MSITQHTAASEKEGSAEALAWLDLLGDPFVLEIVLPNTTKSLKPHPSNMDLLERSPFLRAYPNPSNGPVFVVYEIPEGVERAELLVVDASGKLITTRNVPPQNGIFELSSLSSGLCIATLRCDGIRIGVVKVSVAQ
jgi:hypothetical protein